MRENRTKRAVFVLLLILALAAVAVIAVLLLLRGSGAKEKEAENGPVFEEIPVYGTVTEAERADIAWQEGWVKYNGDVYSRKKDITTLLVMGIDKEGETQEVAEGTNGGQADGLFLLIFDPGSERVRALVINRNAMTDVDVYDESGSYVRTVKAQICTQHGFGNGLEESCEYQKKAVERFLYQMPIDGYAAVNMTSVGPLTDAVGGVDVTVLEDLTKWDKTLVKGAEVHLQGQTAYVYTTRRDINIPGSADGRLARQRQYLMAFMKKIIARIKANPLSAVELYQALSREMTTDISAGTVIQLATQASGYTFDTDVLTLEGETVKGESGFEEFHTDEEALYRLLLELFYDKVDPDAAS